jgi:hypothetical protein
MEECVKLRKRILGVDHSHTMSSSTALAALAAAQEEAVGACLKLWLRRIG